MVGGWMPLQSSHGAEERALKYLRQRRDLRCGALHNLWHEGNASVSGATSHKALTTYLVLGVVVAKEILDGVVVNLHN